MLFSAEGRLSTLTGQSRIHSQPFDDRIRRSGRRADTWLQ